MNDRRKSNAPTTVAEVAVLLAPWLGIFVVLMLGQWLLVVVIDDVTIQRLTENARTVFRRNGDVTAYDGLYSVITLMLTGVGIGAAALTTSLGHLRRDDRWFGAALAFQFILLAAEEQIQFHREVGGTRGALAVLLVHAAIALGIAAKWPQRILRVWPLIVVAAGSLVTSGVLDRSDSDRQLVMYAEEWLELLAAVFLAGIALTLARQAISDATKSRRFAQPPKAAAPTAPPTAPVPPTAPPTPEVPPTTQAPPLI